MNKRLLRRLGIAAALALAGDMRVALALEGYPESWCREGMFGGPHATQPDLRPGRIVGKGRAHLLSDDDGCPFHPSRGQNCRQKYSISSSSPVAVLPSAMPGLACVLNLGNPGQLAGWLPQARVQMSTLDRAPPLAAWKGRWQNGDDTIVLTLGRGGKLSAHGHAYWPGRGVPPGHTGALSGAARPEGNRVTFATKTQRFALPSWSCSAPTSSWPTTTAGAAVQTSASAACTSTPADLLDVATHDWPQCRTAPLAAVAHAR